MNFSKKDKILAAYAINAKTKMKQKSNCPSENDMAAYIDGKISLAQKKVIDAHISTCHLCYNEFHEIVSIVGHQKTFIEIIIHYIISSMAFIKDSIEQFWMSLVDLWEYHRISFKRFFLVPAMAIASICFIYIYLMPYSSTIHGIDNSYKLVLKQKMEIKNFILPWEEMASSYSFAPGTPFTKQSLAFSAGLWEGRNELTGENQSKPDFLYPEYSELSDNCWLETAWKNHYYTGKWAALIHCFCTNKFTVSKRFWNEQYEYLNEFKASWNASGKSGIVIERMDIILDILKSIDKSPTKKQLKQICFEITNIINIFCPQNAPD